MTSVVDYIKNMSRILGVPIVIPAIVIWAASITAYFLPGVQQSGWGNILSNLIVGILLFFTGTIIADRYVKNMESKRWLRYTEFTAALVKSVAFQVYRDYAEHTGDKDALSHIISCRQGYEPVGEHQRLLDEWLTRTIGEFPVELPLATEWVWMLEVAQRTNAHLRSTVLPSITILKPRLAQQVLYFSSMTTHFEEHARLVVENNAADGELPFMVETQFGGRTQGIAEMKHELLRATRRLLDALAETK